MKRIFLIISFVFCVLNSSVFAQFGIRAGVNLANEIKSLRGQDISNGFKKENLTGYQIGLVYQFMPKCTGIGADFAVMLSQKGYAFTDSQSVTDMVIEGYKEINYFEIPINLKYRLMVGVFGVYAYGGVYAGYMLNGKSVDETQNSVQTLDLSDFMSGVDYGYNFGFGVEFFRKIQLGASWTNGLKEIGPEISPINGTYNRVFSFNLSYFF